MIFVDTSFWVAAISARESRHQEALELYRAHAGRGLVTSNHVRGETWTFLNRHYSHRVAVEFLGRIERTQRIRVVFVGEAIEAQALRWLRRHDEREYSFVDATSFALMGSLKIREALAFDEDFSAAGFVEVR